MTLDEEARALLVRLAELEKWIANYLKAESVERVDLMQHVNSPRQDIEARALSTYAETIRTDG